MKDRPFFSVVIPTYNRAGTLPRTIKSVLEQEFSDFEIIIVDDGSTDRTSDLIKELKDFRVRYIYQKNQERGAARNHGIKNSDGIYATFLDSDDILYKDYLSHAYEILSQEPNMPFLHTAYEITDVKGKLIKAHKQRNGNLNQQLIYGNSLSCLGVFIKKEILIQHPFIERRELSGSEDYELWMRLASIYPIAYSDKVTAAIIQHEERSVINFSSGKLIRRIELVIEFLVNNKMFIAAYGKQLNIFIAHRFLYLSLHLIMGRHYLLGLKYWMKAFWAKPTIVLTRKSVGIFKNLFISFYSK